VAGEKAAGISDLAFHLKARGGSLPSPVAGETMQAWSCHDLHRDTAEDDFLTRHSTMLTMNTRSDILGERRSAFGLHS